MCWQVCATQVTPEKANAMNQQFHAVLQGREEVIRKPLQPGQKYNSELLIHPAHEVRQFLEPLGPFAMASIQDLDKATQVLDYGFTHPDTKETWYVAGGFVRDDGAVFCLTPDRMTDEQFFKKLGLRIELDKWADSFKVGKYIKRLWSHHRRYVQGDVIAEKDDTITVRLDNGKQIVVRYAPKSPLTEGMNLVSQRCLKVLGYKGEHGTGLRVTALSPRGFTKGHAIVLDHLHYDLVMYETKDLLKSNGRFTFAVDELHPGKLFTDAQSVMNFQLYNGPYMQQWSEAFMLKVIDALQDEEKLRQMLRFYNITFHKWDHDDVNQGAVKGEYINKDKDWALLRALRSGIKLTDKPALIRKVLHLFLDKVMDCERDVRIPVPAEVGGARYILVDPTIFDMWGNPSLDGVLKGNEVYCPGVTGPVAFHRQPNAHRGEHHIATSVQDGDLRSMDTGSFLFMSKDAIVGALKTLGGGDQDDRVVYYNDEQIVAHFASLPAYPIQQVVAKPVIEANTNRFSGLLKRPRPVYDRTQIKVMLAQQNQQRVSIGQAVNPIMIDTIISDQQGQIVNYLEKLENRNVKENAALGEMQHFEGYRLKGVASQLEAIIDAVKRDGADVSVVANDIRNFWEWLPVVPEFATRGGRHEGRLPNSRRGDAMPVIVQTVLDDVLRNIHDARVDLEDFTTELSWQVVADIPEEILTYPSTLGDEQLAQAIRTEYHKTREAIMGAVPADNVEARIQAFLKVDELVYNKFKNHPIIEQAMIRLYALIYSKRMATAPVDPATGRPRAFPDGLLWGPFMGGLTIKALDRAELTGRFVEVEFYPESKKYARGEHNVVVGGGVVSVGTGENDQVGMTDPIADGATAMQGGLIKVPTDAVQPRSTVSTDVLTVVAGWSRRKDNTRQNIQAWKNKASQQVTLEPYVFVNDQNEEEHAVRVVLEDGTIHGHIARRDAGRIIVTTMGWLAPAADSHSNTMTVIVKGGN